MAHSIICMLNVMDIESPQRCVIVFSLTCHKVVEQGENNDTNEFLGTLC